jgi:hypothetical protein
VLPEQLRAEVEGRASAARDRAALLRERVALEVPGEDNAGARGDFLDFPYEKLGFAQAVALASAEREGLLVPVHARQAERAHEAAV